MGSSLTKGTVRVQVRKDTASNWTSADPTLGNGEFGLENDTKKLKIGDGSTAWTDLGYIGVSSEGITDGYVLTADGSDGAAWEAGGAGGSFKKEYISRRHRYGQDSSPSLTELYGGYSQSYSRGSVLWGITSDADTTITGWVAVGYGDYLAHAPCTVTGLSAVARQDNSDADVELCLFKTTTVDNDSHTANQACDFICKISWTANADTSSLHAVHTAPSFDATAADLAAGDGLILGFRYLDTAGTDAKYWYINHTIEITHD